MTPVPVHDSVAATLDIRLLGPVELVRAQRAVPLGGPRMRTLLGLLALRAPDVVSRDALIEGIWDGTSPGRAATTLRAHVAYLRRGIAAAGVGELVATRPPGYCLAVTADRVDAHRFAAGVATGRAAAASGRAETAAGHLRAALRLWRGEALAGCETGVWARAEVARLQELRLFAMEELLCAELRLGQHAQAVAELESLVTRYPLRERLWELLMRALHQGGRQGDALGAYQRARARLVEELGVEPGAALRRLEAAILAGRDSPGEPVPTTAGQAAVAATAAVGVPATAPTGPGVPAAAPLTAAVPAPLTSLVGRTAEIAELTGLLARSRLVTLTGPGGAGKTRLAIAVAGAAAGQAGTAVRFVDLSAVIDPELIPTTVAARLGVPEQPGTGSVESLVRHLRPGRCLLVLDNCEHLLPALAQLVEPLLRLCPELRVLATSRHTLAVSGELAWPVPPLSVPPCPPPATLAQARRYGAVRLFLDRVSPAVAPGLNDAHVPGLAAICAGLDGLPLAIELAAARTAVLTVAEIADRLHDPALLRAQRRTDRPDHRALDATIAWSYALLDPPTQSRLRRLAVFAGGFTLAGARAVWAGDAAPDTVDVLADLVAKSLLVMRPQPGGARYHLLETIRRWLAGQLAAVPAEHRDARARHIAYHLALAEEADQRLRGPDTAGWLDRLAGEHDNLRAALAWSAADPATAPAALRLAVALAQYCQLRGHYGDGRRWLELALGHADAAPTHLVGAALAARARFAFLLGEYRDAQAYAQRALAAHRRGGDHAATARMLRLLGSVARERGDYPASLDWLGQALAMPGADRTAVADARQMCGFTAWLAGDLDTAEHQLLDALACYRHIADPESIASTLIHLAAVAYYRGQLGSARRLADEGLAEFTRLGAREGTGWALNLLGLVALRDGRPGEAVTALRSSLAVHQAIGDRWRQASVLEALAAAYLAAPDLTAAAEAADQATALRDALGVPVPAVERPDWDRTRARLQRRPPTARDAVIGAEDPGAASAEV